MTRAEPIEVPYDQESEITRRFKRQRIPYHASATNTFDTTPSGFTTMTTHWTFYIVPKYKVRAMEIIEGVKREFPQFNEPNVVRVGMTERRLES